MNTILKRMRDQLADVDTDEARTLVDDYDAHEWFVTPTVAAPPDLSETGNESAP